MTLMVKIVIGLLVLVGLIWLFSWWLFKALEKMDIDQ